MKIPFFGKNKKNAEPDKQEVLLALDIGTQFVKAVIFRIIDNQVHVIGYARTPQQSNSMYSAMIVNLKNVITTTDICVGKALAVAEKIEGGAVDLPEKVILGIAGELVKGVTIAADFERENPDKKIEQKEINEVVGMVKEQMFDKVHEDIAEELGLKKEQIEEIDTKLVAAHIDDVKIDNPLGFTGTQAEFSIYTTFSPSIHLNSLKELADQLGLEIMQIVVEPYAIARSVKEAHNENFSGIFIDIGGGTTDLAVVDKGTVMGTKMFAFGGQVFTKRIAKTFDIEMEEAEKLKIEYADKKLTDVKMKQIEKAFDKDVKIWTQGIELALEEFEDVDEFPAQMYFCGGGAHLPDIRSALIAHPWIQVLPFKKFPKMSYIYPNQLGGLIDQTKLLIDPIDVAPASLALMTLEQ